MIAVIQLLRQSTLDRLVISISRAERLNSAGSEEEMKWWIVEIADGNDGFISEFAETAEQAEQMAMDEGYDVLWAHEEE